ncbi:MAG TPA: NAD(P)H-binding protein [Thermoanaerobaculia bacterium]|jgi:nucleoside-diphosphate-sugar epimerase
MKVLLTGATGFTGSHLLEQLVAEGIQPRCLVRRPEDAAAFRARGLDVAIGDIGHGQSMATALRGIDTLINVASIGFGSGPTLVEAAEEAGVRRAIFVSTTAIFTSLNAKTKSVRQVAEARIQNSTLQWTIIRPTMIYGTARDRNMIRLVRFLQRWPVVPIAGNGEHLQQPVYVDDVARAVVLALRNDVSIGRAYNIAGRDPLTFNQVIDTVARLLGRRIRKLHVPVAPIVKTLQLVERTRVRLPIKAEQILRLNENKAFDYSDAARDLGYAPLSFEEGIAREIAALR